MPGLCQPSDASWRTHGRCRRSALPRHPPRTPPRPHPSPPARADPSPPASDGLQRGRRPRAPAAGRANTHSSSPAAAPVMYRWRSTIKEPSLVRSLRLSSNHLTSHATSVVPSMTRSDAVEFAPRGDSYAPAEIWRTMELRGGVGEGRAAQGVWRRRVCGGSATWAVCPHDTPTHGCPFPHPPSSPPRLVVAAARGRVAPRRPAVAQPIRRVGERRQHAVELGDVDHRHAERAQLWRGVVIELPFRPRRELQIAQPGERRLRIEAFAQRRRVGRKPVQTLFVGSLVRPHRLLGVRRGATASPSGRVSVAVGTRMSTHPMMGACTAAITLACAARSRRRMPAIGLRRGSDTHRSAADGIADAENPINYHASATQLAA